jgi:uncharacterized protein
MSSPTDTATARQVYQVQIAATPEQIWETITTTQFTSRYSEELRSGTDQPCDLGDRAARGRHVQLDRDPRSARALAEDGGERLRPRVDARARGAEGDARARPERVLMSVHFVFGLTPPRPTFTQDMADEERATMDRHAAWWQSQIDAGKTVVFGPVLGKSGAWGLSVLEAESDENALALTRSDPAVTEGVGRYELARMLGGFVRRSQGAHDAQSRLAWAERPGWY